MEITLKILTRTKAEFTKAKNKAKSEGYKFLEKPKRYVSYKCLILYYRSKTMIASRWLMYPNYEMIQLYPADKNLTTEEYLNQESKIGHRKPYKKNRKSKKCRSIVRTDAVTGEVKIYKSYLEAEQDLKKFNPRAAHTKIYACINTPRRTAYGFYWKYLDDVIDSEK